MRQDVIIIGASGHGKVIADIVRLSGDYVFGLLDDAPDVAKEFLERPILGTINDYQRYLDKKFVIAIGNSDVRERIAEQMHGAEWYTAIHPSAVVSQLGTRIGEGTVIMANAVINPGTSIGKHCIINTGAIIDHDNQIEDYVHVSVGAKLAGTVSVGRKTWIGIGASIRNNTAICADCMIGAGAVVVKDIEEKGTYIGVPAAAKPPHTHTHTHTPRRTTGSSI